MYTNKKRGYWITILLFTLIILFVAVVVAVMNVSGQSLLPDGVERWLDVECSLVCYYDPISGTKCYTCTSNECIQNSNLSSTEETVVPALVSTDTPHPINTPIPTDTPEPASTPESVPTDKLKCNQGRKSDDGCTPGNSDNRHSPNDPQEGPRQ